MTAPKVFPEGTALTENHSYEWTKEGGEVPVKVFDGSLDEIGTRYLIEKISGSGYGTPNLGSIGFEANNGRARLVVRYVRENHNIEELYAVDVMKDICTATYFSSLTDKEMAIVRYVHDNPMNPVTNTPDWDAIIAAWSQLQQTLYTHYVHGAESYIDKQFILRTVSFVSSAVVVKSSFANLGNVSNDTPPLSSNMQRLIASLPNGEWLQGPITANYLGKGRWQIDDELQWAKKWSVVYTGGTLFAPVPVEE